jgi:hypothetical protein
MAAHLSSLLYYLGYFLLALAGPCIFNSLICFGELFPESSAVNLPLSSIFVFLFFGVLIGLLATAGPCICNALVCFGKLFPVASAVKFPSLFHFRLFFFLIIPSTGSY